MPRSNATALRLAPVLEPRPARPVQPLDDPLANPLANPFVTSRNVSLDRSSLTRECSVTRDSGNRGKPSRAPTSIKPRG
ncbi:hypothetical protein, partial [Paraburkholderia sp.]|uniref:hypothetical protein n=1 Tax=Paraburkholderia sp. TaxID=1926495 RepID=UPI002ED310BF